MRYHDARHVDVGSFYARLPNAGKVYRLLGYLGIAALTVSAWRGETRTVLGITVVMLLAWLVAWHQVVGTLWRSSLVAAILTGLVYLSCERISNDHPLTLVEAAR